MTERPEGELLPASLIREALRDATAAPGRSLLVLAVAAAVMVSVGLGELQTTGRVLSDEAAFIAAGGFSVVASNEDQAVDAQACLQAGRSPGVRHVAAIGHASTVVVATAPHARFFQLAVSRDSLSVIAPQFHTDTPVDPEGGWILGGAAALELGVQVSDNLTAQGVTRRVAMVVPEGAFRLESLARSLMTFDRLGDTIERCVLDLDRATFNATQRALFALFIHAGEDVTVGTFHHRDALVLPPAAAVAQRPTRRASLAGALVIGVVGALGIWARRTDVAVRRSVGMTRWATTAIMTVEHAIVLWPSVTTATAVTVAVGAITQPWLPADQLVIVMRSILIAAIGSFLIMIPAALITALQSSAATLKDR